MGKKSKASAKQPPLLTPAEPEYLWIPVAQLECNDSIVVADQEYKVHNVERQGGEWVVSLVNLETRAKTEQFYNAHDHVYAKATRTVKARLTHV